MMCSSVLKGLDSPGFILNSSQRGEVAFHKYLEQSVLNGPLLLCLMDSGDVHDSLCYCSFCEVQA